MTAHESSPDPGAVERAARAYAAAGTADFDAMSPHARDRLLTRMGAALAAAMPSAETVTEWGVRAPDGRVRTRRDETRARREAQSLNSQNLHAVFGRDGAPWQTWIVVSRRVTPWGA